MLYRQRATAISGGAVIATGGFEEVNAGEIFSRHWKHRGRSVIEMTHVDRQEYLQSRVLHMA